MSATNGANRACDTAPVSHDTAALVAQTGVELGPIGVQLVPLEVDGLDRMRKSFDALVEVVRSFLKHDPLSGNLFVFRNRGGHLVKVIWWDTEGLAIFYKRLEKGVFQVLATGGDTALGGDDFDRAIAERMLGERRSDGLGDRIDDGAAVGTLTITQDVWQRWESTNRHSLVRVSGEIGRAHV